MTVMSKLLLGAAVLASTIATPLASTFAMPLARANGSYSSTDITNARVVCGPYRCYDEDSGSRDPDPVYERPTYQRPTYQRPRVYIEPQIIIRPRVERRVYVQPQVIYRGGNRHIQWCLNRYRSYNPETDTFLAYGNVYKYCNSPYN